MQLSIVLQVRLASELHESKWKTVDILISNFEETLLVSNSASGTLCNVAYCLHCKHVYFHLRLQMHVTTTIKVFSCVTNTYASITCCTHMVTFSSRVGCLCLSKLLETIHS